MSKASVMPSQRLEMRRKFIPFIGVVQWKILKWVEKGFTSFLATTMLKLKIFHVTTRAKIYKIL